MNTERSANHVLGELAEVIRGLTQRAEQLTVAASSDEKRISKTDAGRATAEDAIVLDGVRDYFAQLLQTASATLADATVLVDAIDRGEAPRVPVAARARMDALRTVLPPAPTAISHGEASGDHRLYTVEPRGDAWAIIVGRDETHRGLTLGSLSCVGADLPRRIEAALNREPNTARSPRELTDADIDLVAELLIEGWRSASTVERDRLRRLVRSALARVQLA